ncbi:EF-hand [Gigaspora margarita]|uniref:EF-hand n=1 Tax=Gigaspora margarita TaxID=4874 RepID=A0A8H3X4R4_GIGMA|nr:EF-hand [Gigaspora margarita]
MQILQGDHVVQFNEFERLIDRLQYYNVIYEIFHDLDKDENKSIDFEEFKKGYLKLLEKFSEAKLREEFNKIDKDHGGRIRFEEFCDYAVDNKVIREVL